MSILTIDDIEKLDKAFLTVQEVATFMKCSPQLIRDQAEADPKFLGFPISKICHRYRIPKNGFVTWYKGEFLSEQAVLHKLQVLWSANPNDKGN